MKKDRKEKEQLVKYSWAWLFDEVKAMAGETVTIEMKSKRRFTEPRTPRGLKGYSYWYAKYEPEKDAVRVWGYGSEKVEWRDPEDGYWGMETERDKWEGLRNRNGEWIEPLKVSME